MSNKVVNKNKLKYMNEFPIIIMIVVAIIVIILAMMYLSIKPHSTIYTNGYMVLSGNMTYNLINDINPDEELNIGVASVSNGDYLYKQMDNYYVGVEKKIEVEQNYPIYSSDGLTIYNLRDDVTLIDRNFEKLKGYPGLSLNYGILYNSDEEEPADDIDYLFLDLNNSIYINAQTMVIKTLMNEYTIPMNSPVYFNTNYISYYAFDGKNFIYNKISDIYHDSVIKIGDVTLTYNEFLLQMELIKLKENLEIPKEELEEQQPEEPKQEIGEENNEQENETLVEYVKPSVSATDFGANVYSATTQLTITDPAGVITSNPMFEIYTMDDKLYSRNRFSSSGNARLTGLSSNTEYKIVGTYKYKNKEGVSLISTFYEGTIKTKDINSLDEIKISTELGETYSNKIEIKNLNILNVDTESVIGIKEVTLNVWEEDTKEIKEFDLSYSQIVKLKNGEKITYSTPESLKSTTAYEYIFKFYDKDNNELKISGDISGAIKTSKQPPKVDVFYNIDTKKNNITINVKTKNPDKLNINDYKYQLYSQSGELLIENKLDYLNDEQLLFENLDYNSNYILKISGIYDLEDGKGIRKIVEEKSFTTINLKENFTAWYDENTLEVTYNKMIVDVYLGTTLAVLEKPDTEIIVYLTDKNGNDIIDENGNLKYYKKYTKKEYSNPNSVMVHTRNEFEGLESNTEYKIKVRINIKQLNKTVFIEKEINPSITTDVEHAYVIVKSKKLMGNTLSFNLKVTDNNGLLAGNGVIIDIYKGKLNSEKDISEYSQQIYRKQINVKDNDVIDLSLYGYDEDEYTIFVSSNPYHNINIKKYLTVRDSSNEEKTAINVDRQIKIKLEMYEQQELKKSLNESYYTKIRVKYEMPNIKENVFLFDCVNNECLSVGYIDAEKNFKGQNKFYESNHQENIITLSFENKKNDGEHKLYAVVERNLSLSTKVDAESITESKLLSAGNVYFLANLDYNTNQPIYNISTAEQLYAIPNKNKNHYVVTENLNLKNIIQYNRGFQFYGTIDFQGYSADLYRNNNNVFSVFNRLESTGIIKNAILNYNLYYDGVVEGLPGFIANNYGTIENIITNVKQCHEENGMLNCDKNSQTGRANNLGLLTTNNYGTINNFVVNLKSDIHTYGTSSLVTVNNNSKSAVISNGYVTTDSNSKIILHDEGANHATFANTNIGTIKNVYNLVSVVSAEQKYTGSGIATIVRNNNGKTAITKNTISVATTTHHTTRRNGPNVYYNTGEATQNYYVETNSKNLNYSGNYNEKIGVETLINPSFWEKTINKDNKFQVVSGYYPILNMNSFMEKQQELKPIGFDFYGQDQIDITLNEVIKDNKDGTPAEIKVYISNPKMREITDIVIDGVTSEFNQEEIEYDQASQMSIVSLKLSIQNGDKAKSTYNITKLKYKDDLGGEHEKPYVNENVRKINVDMYRFVDTYDEFINSLNDNENIYLTNNISSNNSSRLPNNITYTGKLDGNNKMLDLSELALYDSKTKETTNIITRGYFLYDTSFAIIKNLQVKGLQIKSNAAYLGFIRRAIDSVLENIDVSGIGEKPNNIILTGTRDLMYVGGIVAYIDHTELRNVSVNNLNIKKAETEEYNGTIKNNYIGGIVGYAGNSKLQNSYVYDLNVSNMYKDYSFGATSVGGIVGNNGVTDVINCYSVGKIETEYTYVGGIVGKYSHGDISNNFSYMSISSIGDYLGGIIGWSNPNTTIQNNMFIGDLRNNKTDANVSLIAPSSSGHISINNYVLTEESKYKTFTVIEDTNNFSQFDVNDAFDEDENIDDLPYLKETSFVDQKIKKDTFKNNSKLDFTYEIQYDVESCKTNENVIETAIYKNACANEAKIVFKNKDLENTIIDPSNIEISSVDDKLIINKENNYIILKPNDIYVSNYEIKVKISNESEEKIIILELPFYRKISDQDDWNLISDTINENVILLDNIKINNSVGTNKKINNLLGNGFSIDGELDIGRASLEDNLIYSILGTMQDVTIKNINITKDDSTGVGVIKQNEGKILYSKFKNINITNSNNYTGIIAINQGLIKLNPDDENNDINIDNVTVSGISYVGGLVGYNESDISSTRIYNVVANDITVLGTSYVGGVVGRSNYVSTGIKVTKANINGKEYVGGIIGYGTVTSSSISNSEIYASGNYVGGVGGSSINNVQHERINVEKVQIIDNSKDETKTPVYIGGIYGTGNYFNYCTVSELIIGKNIQKNSEGKVTYDAYNANHIGGISSRSVGVTGCKVDNIKIKGKYNIGGIAANSAASQYGVYNNVVSNSEIIGVSTVGGIFGKFTATTDSSQTIKNNVVINTTISASDKNAGGIVGYMENTNTYSQNMKILGNLALGVTVSGTTDAGGLIGKIYQIPSSSVIQLKNNLFYGDISEMCDTCTLVGNIENKNTGALSGYGSNIMSIEEFTNKSNFKQYVGGEKTISYQINSLDELNDFMMSVNDVNLKYPDGDQNFFPVYIKGGTYPNIDNYVEIPISTYQMGRMMMSYGMLRSRSFATSYNNPIDIDFDVYSSGVNKINIEFSNVDDSSYFYYKIGEYVSNSIPIDTRTFTLTYDYKAPISVYVTNNFNQKEKTITPKEIARTISLVNNQTYYINNNSLYSESKMITGNFMNLYNNEVLSYDGKIYNIITKQEYDANINYEILREPVPIYETSYKGNNIKTYYNYSVVNGEVKNMQMFIKNGNLSSIGNSLTNKKNMYIIDFYNDNEIQIILKEDGKLYSIKQNIKYPNNFNNSKINELYTNINSENNIAILKYENGEVYTFDYRTGKLLFTNISNANTSILDYIKNKVSNSTENSIIENVGGHDKYFEIELLKNKIIDVSIEEAKDKIYNSNNSLNKKEDYIIVYNETIKNYEVFKSSTLLKNELELESETDKIYQNYELVKFYKTLGKSKNKNSISGIILFAISIVLILISLALLIRNKIGKKGETV